MSNKPFAGTLDNWHVDFVRKDYYIIWGNIREDLQHRFRPGSYIHTSDISKKDYPIESLKKRDRVETRNSVYELGKPLEEVIKNG